MDVKIIKDKIFSMRALYVEDDDEVRSQTAKILRVFFHSVTECNNGYDGIKKFKESAFDIVFTDINMSGINGLEMIEKIKQINPLVKTVIFSAYSESKFFTKAIQISVDGYLIKPFSTDDLLNILEKIVLINEAQNKNLIYLDGDFIWDKDNLNLIKNDKIIKLTKNEISLLKLLLSGKKRIVTSYEIENELFDDDLCENKRVRDIVSRFHKKIDYKLIENIYSQGYRIKWQ